MRHHGAKPKSGAVYDQIAGLHGKAENGKRVAATKKPGAVLYHSRPWRARADQTLGNHAYCLPVRDFIPEETIDDYTAYCPCCRSNDWVTKRGMKDEPARLIYGRNGKELLWAPQRWECTRPSCIKDGKKTFSFSGTDPESLDCMDLGFRRHHGPFVCTRKSGVTLDLLNEVVDLALNGVGPSAAATIISKRYCKEHSERIALALTCRQKGQARRRNLNKLYKVWVGTFFPLPSLPPSSSPPLSFPSPSSPPPFLPFQDGQLLP